jgi:hypothetical protein
MTKLIAAAGYRGSSHTQLPGGRRYRQCEQRRRSDGRYRHGQPVLKKLIGGGLAALAIGLVGAPAARAADETYLLVPRDITPGTYFAVELRNATLTRM